LALHGVLLAPLLIIVIAIAGSVFGEEAAGEIVGQIRVSRQGWSGSHPDDD